MTVVVDSSGNSAKYAYDAAGNLLSISTTSAGQVSILQFTPSQGVPGAAVTISGAGFSATPSQNTVQFNGVAATVTSAATTQIIATVPASATSGPITVTAPSGSGTSASPFTVASDVSNAITPGGAPVTVAIPSPGQKARVTFAGTAGQKMALSITGLAISQSDISVLNPDGTNLVAPTYVIVGGIDLIDVPALAAPGNYTILVAPRSNFTGSVTLQLVMDLVTPITASGAAINLNLVKGQNARLTFTGTAGQKVSVRMTALAVSQTYASILNTNGSTLAGPVVVTSADNDGFIDATPLPADGSYTVLIDPQGSAAGSMTVNLYNVVDATATITPGGPTINVPTTTPGQNVRATFSGAAGQTVKLTVDMASSEANNFAAYAYIFDPNGAQLFVMDVYMTECTPSSCDTGFLNNFVRTFTLPCAGTYTILLDPITRHLNGFPGVTGSYTGSNYLTLSNVP